VLGDKGWKFFCCLSKFLPPIDINLDRLVDQPVDEGVDVPDGPFALLVLVSRPGACASECPAGVRRIQSPRRGRGRIDRPLVLGRFGLRDGVGISESLGSLGPCEQVIRHATFCGYTDAGEFLLTLLQPPLRLIRAQVVVGVFLVVRPVEVEDSDFDAAGGNLLVFLPLTL
jgi:hypothetical protein